MALNRYIELEIKSIFGIRISKKRNMIVAERFLSNVIKSTEIMLSQQMEVLGIHHKPAGS